MEYIGKGIGTIGIWGAVAVVVVFGGDTAMLVGIMGFACAVFAMTVIW